jgi:hypothetical protein
VLTGTVFLSAIEGSFLGCHSERSEESRSNALLPHTGRTWKVRRQLCQELDNFSTTNLLAAFPCLIFTTLVPVPDPKPETRNTSRVINLDFSSLITEKRAHISAPVAKRATQEIDHERS